MPSPVSRPSDSDIGQVLRPMAQHRPIRRHPGWVRLVRVQDRIEDRRKRPRLKVMEVPILDGVQGPSQLLKRHDPLLVGLAQFLVCHAARLRLLGGL